MTVSRSRRLTLSQHPLGTLVHDEGAPAVLDHLRHEGQPSERPLIIQGGEDLGRATDLHDVTWPKTVTVHRSLPRTSGPMHLIRLVYSNARPRSGAARALSREVARPT